jgi:uncharacterized protein (TIGR01319 family)
MSILCVDFGSVYTRAILLDVVDGVYQLIARAETRTTDGFPVNDVTVGLDRVLRELNESTGRVLTNPAGTLIVPEQANRTGVDLFSATTSMGRPLRLLVVGLTSDISTESALKSIRGTFIDVVDVLNLNDHRDEQDRINTVILSQPDTILIVGGTEGGAELPILNLTENIRQAVSLMDASRRPSIIYAGNSSLQGSIQTLFDGLSKVFIADNLRPSLGEERLYEAREKLVQAFDLHQEKHSRSFSNVAELSEGGVRPSLQGYTPIVEYLHKANHHNVVAVDVGSASSVLTTAIDGKVTTTIRANTGVGQSALALADALDDEIFQQLPFYATRAELENYAANKMLRPAHIPTTMREIYIEHALLKGAVRLLWQDAALKFQTPAQRQIGTLIGAGASFSNTGSPGYSALLMLDAVQPLGITQLYSDPYALTVSLGALASSQPEAVVQTLESGNLEYLGTCFSISGMPRIDGRTLSVTVSVEGSTSETFDVQGGHLRFYPLPLGQQATVQVRILGRGVSIGGRSRFRQTVQGGTAGLIFDARGRTLDTVQPLQPVRSFDLQKRAYWIPRWIAEATGDPLREIDPAWLTPPASPVPPSTGSQRNQRVNRRFGRNQPGAPLPDFPDDLSSTSDNPEDELRALRDATLS